MYLIQHQKEPEKTLVCASTNVAVDEALAKAYDANLRTPGANREKPPTMRFWSNAAIKDQYSQNDPALYHPCHIEQHCRRLAEENPAEYGNFLKWTDEARVTGFVGPNAVYDCYVKMRTELARLAMKSHVHVVYCTLTATRSPLLYEPDPRTFNRFEPKWFFNPTTIIIDERSVAIRVYVMIPVIVYFNVR